MMKRIVLHIVNAPAAPAHFASSTLERIFGESARALNPAAEVRVAAVAPGEFIDAAEASKGDYEAALRDTVAPMDAFEALICPGSAGEAAVDVRNRNADVTYALYTKQIPVLILLSEPPASTRSRELQHPLLRINVANDASSVEAAVAKFLTFPAVRGKVFVVEGGDGSGKQTQVKLLCDRLAAERFPVATLDYPHDSARYGVLIRELLAGKMGSIRDVDPLMFASLYGLNRHDTLPRLKLWLQRGRNVVLDRYVSANFGHQASKLATDAERNAVIQKLSRFEFGWLGLPDVDAVLYLNLAPDFALRAMQQDETRRELDMHEKAGVEYKNNVRRAFLWCCETQRGWQEVKCLNEDETVRRTRQEVHDDIYARLKSAFVNHGVLDDDN